ncbi:hypothetical protein ABIC83_002403 [Roseateles asaccharophilus]|uniref:hypothetical protein n=1 Tax=Roseateles asaccharophilus TaxID=582607 RepID=UPI003832AD0E
MSGLKFLDDMLATLPRRRKDRAAIVGSVCRSIPGADDFPLSARQIFSNCPEPRCVGGKVTANVLSSLVTNGLVQEIDVGGVPSFRWHKDAAIEAALAAASDYDDSPKHFVPTQVECETLRRAAAHYLDIKPYAAVLQPGLRWSGGSRPAMNIALISDDPTGKDTDLADFGTWAQFRKGFDLAKGGRAVIDFYVYRHRSPDLQGNVVLFIENGQFDHIRSVELTGPVIWRAGVGFL